LLAALDDWGAVRLFRCPSDVGRADYATFLAHGPRPGALAFTFNDEYVLSYGAGDRAVVQWRHVAPGERPRQPEELTSDVEEEALAAPHERDVLCRTCAAVPACVDGYAAGVPHYVPATQLAAAAHAVQPGPGCEPGSGAAFLPAADALFAPDGYARDAEALAPPAEALQLAFAFGHRAADARANVHAVGGVRGLVSHTGAACYVYDRVTHTMQFCVDDPAAEVGAPPRGHTDAVLCCAAHPGGTLIATGQAGRFPQLLVWSAAAPSSAPVARLPRGALRRGVSALAFSRDGTLLTAADCTPGGARLALYRWATGALLGSAAAGAEAVLSLLWSPFQDYFVSVGLRHCAFWAIDPLRPRCAEFVAAGALGGGGGRARGVTQSCLCAAFPAPDTAAVGTQDGSIYLFRGYALAAAVPRAHAVTHALAARRDALVSAGKEGAVRFWALDLSACLRTLQLAHPLAFGACVKALALVPGSTALLAATRSGEVYEVDAATGSVALLLQGHGRGGVRALAPHPHALLFASAGGDGTLRLWDAASRRPLLGRTFTGGENAAARARPPGAPRTAGALPLRSLSWHPDGTRLAVGTADGRLFLVTADSLDTVASRRDRAVALTALAFSPCGRYLAAGSAESVIDVYELDLAAGAELSRCGVARGHAAAVTACDWSCDSALLQSSGADGSLCFWEMPTVARCAAAADARNADWATHTCLAAWATQGVLPRPGGDSAPAVACDRAHARTCVAVGDAHGVVSLYQYPAHTGATRRLFGGHAGRVAAVRFLADDTHLVTGADDGSLLLWRVVV
jgi:WD40 repeat protein